jgi:phosphopantothenoylcysteine decarboxylase/phosphopantothenate--cysteine ligase
VRSPEPTGPASGRRIVFCVTGGIAAYKAVQVVRDLARAGADVRVVMTASARRLVGEQTLAAVSGNPVATELFGASSEAPHVELARRADLIVVAPATANALAKMAVGLADDLFSATLLTATCPILVAPAMHTEMWEHPATRRSVAELMRRGVVFVGPEAGPLLGSDEGPGRMAEPAEVGAAVLERLGRAALLDGRHLVVSAGGTQEPIDPVRFLGNRSSGRMGCAVARAALERGARVTLVAGVVTVDLPPRAEVVPVRTAEEMRAAVRAAAAEADALVMAAAVADFRPDASASHKLRKEEGPPEIRLVPTSDILAELGRGEARERGLILVGFAAETTADASELARVAQQKRSAKGAEVIVANDVASPDSGFGVPTNRAVIATAEGIADLGLVTKEELATAVVEQVAKLLAARPS